MRRRNFVFGGVAMLAVTHGAVGQPRGNIPDIPIEQATKFDLVINLKTARAQGVNIPRAMLVRADQIMQ